MNVYSFKKKFKKYFPFLDKFTKFKRKRACRNNVVSNIDKYKKCYLKYSTSLLDIADPRYQRRTIIIDSHILEKGLSHSDFRPGFGKQVVMELQDYLLGYLNSSEPDVFAVNNAISLLLQYHKKNVENGFDDSDYLNLDKFNIDAKTDLSPYDVSSLNLNALPDFRPIAEARHSVRSYEQDGDPISSDIIMNAIALANSAPSACNRQATHVFVIEDREKLFDIENIHGGCKGFGRHVSVFMFVASDVSLYSSNEFKLPIFDAGIYTMNLLYALQSYGLYSCVLNASFPGEQSKKIHQVTGIPERYDINGLVAVYKLNKNSRVKIAVSPRRKATDTLTYLT